MGDWLGTVVPSVAAADRPSLVLDGDLPKAEWFEGERSPRLSECDGEKHTVVPGRPIGLHPPTSPPWPTRGSTSTSTATSPTVNEGSGSRVPDGWRRTTFISSRRNLGLETGQLGLEERGYRRPLVPDPFEVTRRVHHAEQGGSVPATLPSHLQGASHRPGRPPP